MVSTDPTEGAALNTPNPDASTSSISLANTGRSAIAPPNKTANMSNARAAKSTCVLLINCSPVITSSHNLPLVVDSIGCITGSHNELIPPTHIDTMVSTAAVSTPNCPYTSPPIRGPSTIAACQAVLDIAVAFGSTSTVTVLLSVENIAGEYKLRAKPFTTIKASNRVVECSVPIYAILCG